MTARAALDAEPAGRRHGFASRLAGEPTKQLAGEHKELRNAIFEAVQVHRKLCAPREARRGPFEIAGETFAVRHLSGDFLKILDLGSKTGLALGDIAGKGLSAGLWVAHLIGLTRIYVTEQGELSTALESINRALCGARHGGPSTAAEPLVALFLARLDPHSSELEYCNAGQPAALLLRSAGTVESLEEGGPVLGALPEATFRCGRVRLEPGDTLVAYSDGVVESRGPADGDMVRAYSHTPVRQDSALPQRAKSAASRSDCTLEEFGIKRLTAAIRAANGSAVYSEAAGRRANQTPALSAAQVLFSALGSVQDFAGGRQLEDDLTLLVVRHRR